MKNWPVKCQTSLPLQVSAYIIVIIRQKHLDICANMFCSLLLETEPKDAGSEKSSGVVRLNTIRQIIEQVRCNRLLYSFMKALLQHLNLTCSLCFFRTTTHCWM